MSFLLDTCVLSEYSQKEPDAKVLAWIDGVAETRLHISTVTLGEIRQGAAHVAGTAKSTRILAWLENELLPRFGQRILPVDTEVALRWGELGGLLLRRGKPPALLDSLIAATALVHDLTLVTRNARDFHDLKVPIVNPWQ